MSPSSSYNILLLVVFQEYTFVSNNTKWFTKLFSFCYHLIYISELCKKFPYCKHNDYIAKLLKLLNSYLSQFSSLLVQVLTNIKIGRIQAFAKLSEYPRQSDAFSSYPDYEFLRDHTRQYFPVESRKICKFWHFLIIY